MKYRALYLHIPFCRAKCLYCDFDSRALTGCALEEAIGAYCEGLSAQVDAHGNAGELSEVETVYVGGGTPSLLGGRLVGLVDYVRAYCEPVEFTCEANPESFTLDLAQALRAAGVTRISLGVQSLNASELKAIGRIHSAEQAMLAIAQAKAAGFSTSCDVMCGLPGQTLDTFAETLRSLVTLNPDHVSVYPLQLEDGTPLARMEEAGDVEVPDEDFQAQCMDLAAEVLKEAGYERYEVASYAKSGHRCRHNIAYWTGKPYLGLGRSAASMLDVSKGECRTARFIARPDAQKGEGSRMRGRPCRRRKRICCHALMRGAVRACRRALTSGMRRACQRERRACLQEKRACQQERRACYRKGRPCRRSMRICRWTASRACGFLRTSREFGSSSLTMRVASLKRRSFPPVRLRPRTSCSRAA